MGIHSIANACAHLQNASRARLGLTSLPNTKYNLRLMLALQRAGFISSVQRGGPHPPGAEAEALASSLAAGAATARLDYGGPAAAEEETAATTTANVATRRLWVGLKYWNNQPVMGRVQAVSRPSRLVTADLAQLNRVSRGFPAGYVKGLNLGECLFLSTDRGVLEVREALDKKVGGLVLCRVS